MAKRPPFNPKRDRAIEQIEQEDWDAIADRLTGYTVAFLDAVFHWHVTKDGFVPGGKPVKDFVDTAVYKLLQSVYAAERPVPVGQRSARGFRKWNPDTHSLVGTLCRIIKSEIYNYAAELKRRRRLLEQETACAKGGQEIGWHSSPLPSSDDVIEEKQARAQWLEALRDRPLGLQVVRLILDEGVYSPSEIALLLGVRREAIYVEFRWIRRNIDPILRKSKVGRR